MKIPTLEMLRQLIGAPVHGDEYSRLVRHTGVTPATSGSGRCKSTNFKQCGITLIYDSKVGHYDGVWLFAKGFEDFSQYQGELPGGVTFDDNREQVRQKLGTPGRDGRRTEPTDPPLVWDLYMVGGLSYDFTYEEPGKLVRVRLGLGYELK